VGVKLVINTPIMVINQQGVIMPNKQAKERKRIKAELNKSLKLNGRTAKQIKRIKDRNIERKKKLEKRLKERGLLR
tara:strand:- start:1854 stop:2081 length:228 start_codon:yes stop_codon:yes gene_type:complete